MNSDWIPTLTFLVGWCIISWYCAKYTIAKIRKDREENDE